MSLTTALDLEFADGAYQFDLKLPQLEELQEKLGPIFEVYGRLTAGRFILSGVSIDDVRQLNANAHCDFEDIGGGNVLMIDWTQARASHADVFETVRLGLIGGGSGMVNGKEIEISPLFAKTLVERYCHSRPLRESWAIAASVVAARIKGYEPKKKAPERKPRQRRKSTSSKS